MHWPSEDLWLAIAPQVPGFSVEVLPTIDSTNTELMRRARAGQTDPVLLVAEQQTAGRGRLGRQWQSQAGDSLTFSLGMNLALADWSGLSLAIGWAITHALDPEQSLGLGLKWPNDVWVMDSASAEPRKLAGILVETASSASGPATPAQARYCVMGVGINLKAPAVTNHAVAPIGLLALKPECTPASVLECVAQPLVEAVLAFERQGFAPFQARFHARDVLRGLAVTLSDGQAGVAQGVSPTGELLLAQGDRLVKVHSAEVSVRPSALKAAG